MSNFSHALRSRCQLTGESPRYLLNAEGLDPLVPIATASRQQAIFEARVMRALLDSPGSLAHPLGVSHIRLPHTGTPPFVHVDAPATATGAPLDQAMANNLLPVRTSDGQATGVEGLRVLKNNTKT